MGHMHSLLANPPWRCYSLRPRRGKGQTSDDKRSRDHRPLSVENIMHSWRGRPNNLIDITANHTEQPIISFDRPGLFIYNNHTLSTLPWHSLEEIIKDTSGRVISTKDVVVNQNEKELPPFSGFSVLNIKWLRASGRHILATAQVITVKRDASDRFYVSISTQSPDHCTGVTRPRATSPCDQSGNFDTLRLSTARLKREARRCGR